jgi:hypothetical protein
MSIYYHGTTKEKADLILKSGFKEGTYFTWDLHSALVMGGMYVFGIWFKDKSPEKSYWEYITSTKIPKSRILYLKKFSVKNIYGNPKEDRKIKQYYNDEHFGRKTKFCTKCDGHGQLNKAPEYGGWHHKNYKVIVCSNCNGHGCTELNGKIINS